MLAIAVAHFRKTEFVLDDETPHGLYNVFSFSFNTDSENVISFSISVTASEMSVV